MAASVESAKTETEVAPSLAAPDADVLTPSHSGTPDTTPTTATSQAAGTPPRVVVPRRPTPHHLSGTKNGRARTRLAASAPAERTAAARVRRGAAAREKGDHRDLRRQERTADPANRRGDPPRASQTGDIAAEVAAAQEPPRAAGDSDGPPRPPRADNRPGTARRAPLRRRTSTARDGRAVRRKNLADLWSFWPDIHAAPAPTGDARAPNAGCPARSTRFPACVSRAAAQAARRRRGGAARSQKTGRDATLVRPEPCSRLRLGTRNSGIS